MGKDKANIFKLDKKELETYKDKEFDDCMPGAKEFAECLKTSILTKETPYVLLLQDNFGMGKTHFSTRFAYFLRNCDIDTIYFSAWENDYIEQPFISFSKEFIKYFNQNKTTLEKFGETSKAIFKLILNIAKSTDISKLNIPLIPPIEIPIDTEKVLDAGKEFINTFIEHDDYLIAFKKSLKNFIASIPAHRLVVIVDELDRCRPDYAMKTLEIIKHFFDIEGLFIIVPTNERSLQKCVKALYGIDEENHNNQESEYYFNKFFTNKLNLYKPDYLKLVQTIIPENSIQHLLENGKMELTGKYNSLETLQQKLAEFGKDFKLTMREMVNVCNKAIYFCHHITKRLDCEYLAYLLCKKASRIENENCRIQSEHPFSVNSKKKELLKFAIPEEVYIINHTNYQRTFMEEYPFFKNRILGSYKEFEELHEDFFKDPTNFIRYKKLNRTYYSAYNFNSIRTYIENKKKAIDSYRNTWNSDDNDDAIKKYYQNIVEDEPSIHAEKLHLAEQQVTQ